MQRSATKSCQCRAVYAAIILAFLVVLSSCLTPWRAPEAGRYVPVRNAHRWCVSYQRLAGDLFAADGPSPYDVEQGEVGSCWLLAAMAATADRQPDLIRRMFRPQEDGTFTVVFQSPRPSFSAEAGADQTAARELSVSISAEVPHSCCGGGPLYARSRRGTWVSLLEKAYAKKFAPEQGYEGMGGDHPRVALAHLTGWRVEDYDVDGELSGPGEDEEWNYLFSAYRGGAPMVAGSRIFQPREDIVPMHAYSVTDMGQDLAGHRFVKLFDPEGLNGQPNYEITLSFEHFNEYFFYVSVAHPPALQGTGP